MNREKVDPIDRLMRNVLKDYSKVLTMEEAVSFMEWSEAHIDLAEDLKEHPGMMLSHWVDDVCAPIKRKATYEKEEQLFFRGSRGSFSVRV